MRSAIFFASVIWIFCIDAAPLDLESPLHRHEEIWYASHMNKPQPFDWDAAFEETAQASAKTFDAAKLQAKIATERAKEEAGIGVYTAEELAAQEAEEADEE
jgi:hypothetical protein